MPRIQFSDVTPPERRSIRDVPIPSGGKRKVPISIKPTPKTEPVDFNSKIAEITEKKNDGPYEYYYPKTKKGRDNMRVVITNQKEIYIRGHSHTCSSSFYSRHDDSFCFSYHKYCSQKPRC